MFGSKGTLHRVNYFLATPAMEEILKNLFLFMEPYSFEYINQFI